MNLYAALGTLKGELGKTATVDDAALLRLLDSVSRAFDKRLNRFFYALTATRVYDGNGLVELWPPDDIVSITSLKIDKDGDQTYETTLVVNTDYLTWPDNLVNEPILRIDVNTHLATQLDSWPKGRRRLQIAGVFGYSNETEASGTLGAAISDTAGTSVTMTAGHGLSGGETIIVDSEQLYVSAVSTNALTVVRGVNGTTAATHLNGVAVSVRRYPRQLEMACRMETARIFREIQTGYSGSAGASDMAGYAFNAMYPAIRDALIPLARMVV